jgi:hypothetical protein
VSRDVDVEDSPSAVLEDEPGVEKLETDRRDDEEVGPFCGIGPNAV